jgi:hypothetical protein
MPDLFSVKEVPVLIHCLKKIVLDLFWKSFWFQNKKKKSLIKKNTQYFFQEKQFNFFSKKSFQSFLKKLIYLT